ncbi:MAG: hypothetical protein EZS28_025967 [Streblomastix strix]|uniref:Uncharacterized protein n=1 Tax=Streblomastix strix TaxID=222440 RepID=A0A5J4V844_9EUKA|nr:MAG: hypothetical protein EZS28_025967 [Streblomastix strix]
MTLALMGMTEQSNLLKTQPSLVIRPGYNNYLIKSLSALPQTEGAHHASKLIAQQVKDLIRCKPKIMLTEQAQDLTRKPTLKIHVAAFLLLLSQLQQQSLNHYTPFNHFYNKPPQQKMQEQSPLQYPFQYFGQPMQLPINPTQFLAIPPLNPFLPMMSQPQTQISELRLTNNETLRDQQNVIQPSHKQNQQQFKQLKDRNKVRQQPEVYTIYQFHQYRYIFNNKPHEYQYYLTQQRDQQQKQIKRSISPKHKRSDESEEDDFLDETMSGIAITHLPPHRNDIETAQ